MVEVWKDIVGYENLYQVSNIGRIKSLSNRSNHKDEKILKDFVVQGYKCINLFKNSIGKMYKVHRLVAQAFISNTENYKEINHIDGNKTNNNVNNLEWCNRSENMKHSYKIGLHKAQKGKENKLSKKINMVDKTNNKIIKTFDSIREAERYANIKHGNIKKSIKKNQAAGGYKWIII